MSQTLEESPHLKSALEFIKQTESHEIPKSTPYFIVGLSNGGTSELPAKSYLMDMIRYAFELQEKEGHFVLFDAPKLPPGYGDWGQASHLAQNKLQAICRAFNLDNIKITKASDHCQQNPERFEQIYRGINQMFWNTTAANPDPETLALVEKIWQIVPPSAKSHFETPPPKTFREASLEEKKLMLSLMDYETRHIAFILACDGEKILHGRSEERSKQVAKAIHTYCTKNHKIREHHGKKQSPTGKEKFQTPKN